MFWCLNCTYNVARVEVMDVTSCGLIQLKSEGFFEKKPERGQGRRVDFIKTQGFICKFPSTSTVGLRVDFEKS